jgi:hypothetical protein
MRRENVALLLPSLIFTGCAGIDWTHPNKTEQQFYADRLDCEQRASSIYPTAVVQTQITPGSVGPANTTCTRTGNQLNCITTPGTVTAPVTTTYDANRFSRSGAVDACLRSLGYVRASEVPSVNSASSGGRLNLIGQELKPEQNPTLRVCDYGKIQRVVQVSESCSPSWP